MLKKICAVALMSSTLSACDSEKPTMITGNQGTYAAFSDGSIYQVSPDGLKKLPHEVKAAAKDVVSVTHTPGSGGCDKKSVLIDFTNNGDKTVAWVKFEIRATVPNDSWRYDQGAWPDPTDREQTEQNDSNVRKLVSTYTLKPGETTNFCLPKPALTADAGGKEINYTPVVVDAEFAKGSTDDQDGSG